MSSHDDDPHRYVFVPDMPCHRESAVHRIRIGILAKLALGADRRLRCSTRALIDADSEEKREPVSDIDTVVVDSLKVLDPKRPI